MAEMGRRHENEGKSAMVAGGIDAPGGSGVHSAGHDDPEGTGKKNKRGRERDSRDEVQFTPDTLSTFSVA